MHRCLDLTPLAEVAERLLGLPPDDEGPMPVERLGAEAHRLAEDRNEIGPIATLHERRGIAL